MGELVEWLRAQLDEDERIARAATERQPYDEWDAVGDERDDDAGRSWWEVLGVARMNQAPSARALAEFIAEHDPARVLREIDAKRRILAEHALNGWVCTTCDNGEVEQVFPCPTLRLLALPYADRPGYREEWRP